MRTSLLLAFLVAPLLAGSVQAQPVSLTYGEDYTLSDELHEVTTIQVAPNRVDHYLAGIQRSWVSANEIAMEMGLMQGYRIYVSQHPNSGDFNVMLVTIFEDADQRSRTEDPATFADFNSRVEAMLSEQESFQITEGYTEIREIMGQYLMREVELQ